MKNIYRKSAIEKLSSPEQLDEMITIIHPSFWVASVSAFVILLAALIWSIFSRVPVKLSTEGIYMSGEGISAVYAEDQGIVEEIVKREGEEIKKGDVLVRLSTREINEKLADTNDRIKKVESVSLNSTGDEVIAENKALLDMKSQLLTLQQNLNATEKMLTLRQSELAEQQSRTNAALAKMQSARNMYYLWMNTGSTTDERIGMDNAQTDLSRARSNYESAKAALDSFNAKNGESLDYLEQKRQRLEKDIADLKEEGADQESIRKVEEEMYSVELEYDSIKGQKDEYQRACDDYGSRMRQAEDTYYNKTVNYINAENTMLAAQTYESQLTDDYNVALNTYNTELSALRSLQEATAQLSVQLSTEELGTTNKYESLKVQFDAEKSSTLDGLKKQKEEYEKQIEKASLKSSLDGYIVSMALVKGSAVSQGTAICTVSKEPLSMRDNTLIRLYVPAAEGKKIRPGMEVMVYPGTVNKQEYGHMEATVENTSVFIASTDDVFNQLGEDSLVQNFMKKGPVIAVTCSLRPDENTQSGYYWSSKKGSEVMLETGTLVTADVVTEKKAPITMVFPMLKEKLTIDKNEILGKQQE